jgi:hypothetical protein
MTLGEWERFSTLRLVCQEEDAGSERVGSAQCPRVTLVPRDMGR